MSAFAEYRDIPTAEIVRAPTQLVAMSSFFHFFIPPKILYRFILANKNNRRMRETLEFDEKI
ncbi:hypothetical protein JCM19039_2525 [Geomicrobium sp. JCM 19039]|nr:hypothetical protein JCM19039_2525 [Geomicrobium sp. JCM 19039]